MAEARLTEEEKRMVRELDWYALMEYGASFFCIEKLARTKGVSNPESRCRVPRARRSRRFSRRATSPERR